MKCSSCQKGLLGADAEDLPAGLRAHLDQCPACRRAYEAVCALHGLVALKRYEHPAPGVEDRCRRAVLRRVKQGDVRESPGAAWWELLTGPSMPALRYGVAAVFVALLAIQFLTIPYVPTLKSAFFTSPEENPPQAREMLAAATNVPADAYQEAVAVPLQIVSNAEPGQIQYGPLPSRNVSYEY